MKELNSITALFVSKKEGWATITVIPTSSNLLKMTKDSRNVKKNKKTGNTVHNDRH